MLYGLCKGVPSPLSSKNLLTSDEILNSGGVIPWITNDISVAKHVRNGLLRKNKEVSVVLICVSVLAPWKKNGYCM